MLSWFFYNETFKFLLYIFCSLWCSDRGRRAAHAAVGEPYFGLYSIPVAHKTAPCPPFSVADVIKLNLYILHGPKYVVVSLLNAFFKSQVMKGKKWNVNPKNNNNHFVQLIIVGCFLPY